MAILTLEIIQTGLLTEVLILAILTVIVGGMRKKKKK